MHISFVIQRIDSLPDRDRGHELSMREMRNADDQVHVRVDKVFRFVDDGAASPARQEDQDRRRSAPPPPLPGSGTR